MQYKFKCPILADQETLNEYRYKIDVFAQGKDGEIKLLPEKKDFGIIMVNFVKTEKFTLYNNS